MSPLDEAGAQQAPVTKGVLGTLVSGGDPAEPSPPEEPRGVTESPCRQLDSAPLHSGPTVPTDALLGVPRSASLAEQGYVGEWGSAGQGQHLGVAPPAWLS